VSLGARDRNAVSGAVVARSYAGDSLTHVVRLADGTTLRTTASLRHGLTASQAQVDDTVTLSWQPDACILLAR
jgi:hypothetical protein